MEKLVVVVMGQDCEKFIGMCLNSVKEGDAVVYLDGGSNDNTKKIFAREWRGTGKNWKIINNKYNQEDIKMNGKQRNFYLNYVKKNYPDWWCLVLDADEVVEDLSKIKEFINRDNVSGYVGGVWSLKMRHLIGDLAHEDNSLPKHFVANRLFKIKHADKYPEIEHPILKPISNIKPGATDCTTIWHLSHIAEAFNVKQKYENHLKKSKMHSSEFLKQWYWNHLFGQFPRKAFNPIKLPDVILKEFNIDKDELYFHNRGLEVKHFIDAIHWKEFFKCKTAYEFGCGRAPRVYAMNHIGIEAYGLEISDFAFVNAYDTNIQKGDILKVKDVGKLDLVIAYDLLEHLEYMNLDIAIQLIINTSKTNILISVPFKGTPNCDNDPTHIIKEDREWWIKQFTDKKLKLIKTPDNFLFKEQILIFKK